MKTLVLLVDDQPIVEAAIRRLMAAFDDVELISATDAEAGFSLALSRRPDVILQDLVMPGMDGLAQIRRLRASPDLANTPLVVLSADSDATTKNACFEAGANDYLVKLPDPLELVARIRYHGRVGAAHRERDRALRALSHSQNELLRRNAEIDAANRRLAALNDVLGQESQEQREKFAEVSARGTKLGRAQDLNEVMQRTLLHARAFTDADAGTVWVVEDGRLRFAYAQNDALEARMQPGSRLPLQDVKLPIDNQSIAGYVAGTGNTLRLEDVYQLPPNLPFRFDHRWDETTGYRSRSMLVAPLRDSQDAIIGVLQLINARSQGGAFSQSDQSALELFAGMASVAFERARLVRGVIMRTIATAELRDPTETGAHVERVAEYSVAIYDVWAQRHGLDEGERLRGRDELRIAAMLHDVGKVAIPDQILQKPGKLDDAEYARMQTHVLAGGRLFAEPATPYDDAVLQVALHHHERWDGRGYPGVFTPAQLRAMHGEMLSVPKSELLRGEQIPLFARIVAVADVYDALSSKRRYKDAWPDEKVRDYFETERGKAFDPEVAEIAISLWDYLRSVRERYPSEAVAS
ncbi:MAG: response regulator [Phycisphaerae bacterium]|nr:response regulator [Phycisphaerae bacterium]